MGRMPNVSQTGLNQAAAANKRMASPAKPGSRNAVGMLPPSQPKPGKMPLQSTRPTPTPPPKNLPMSMAMRKAAPASPKALLKAKSAFNKMKGRGKKIAI